MELRKLGRLCKRLSHRAKKHQMPTEEGLMDSVKENVTDTWEDTKDAASEAWHRT